MGDVLRIGLELCHDEKVVLWRPVEEGSLVVGSNPECDLCVPDASVAPVQCIIHREAARVTLENRHVGGTTIGDASVMERVALANGDLVALGPMCARVRFLDDLSPSANRTQTLVSRPAKGRGQFCLSVPELYPGRIWPLVQGEIRVGSDSSNDVVVDDPFVSSFHARFALVEGRCTVFDLESRNGVFVSDRKVREGEVPPGSQVRLGKTVLMVSTADPGEGDSPIAVTSSDCRLLGKSAAMEQIRERIQRIADHDAPVLICGETGTGKEVVARLLVELSTRALRAFVILNSGALNPNLIESELFGHERGAFTGALERKAGAFEMADAGTLFLDEIGELPLALQPQLLRVLETGEVRRVGAMRSIGVDVRVLAATNRPLPQEVARGAFREDLFHRLHVLTIDLPPLRDRVEDIEELAQHFLCHFTPTGERIWLAPDALQRLTGHDWPGNVRELRNVIQRAVLLRKSDVIQSDDVVFTPSTLRSRVETTSAKSSRTLSEIEREAIVAELRRHRGNKREAAAALGVSRSTIHRKIDELAIDLSGLD